MAPTQSRKMKLVNLTIGGASFEGQLQSINLANNTDDGERFYVLAPQGEFREEPDPDYALELTFFADWRSNGISDYLWTHDGERLEWSADHHPDIATEHVQFEGFLIAKAPNVGGQARSTEMTEVTLPVEGKPTYARVGA